MPKTQNLMLDAVLAWLSEYPEATNKQIAREVGCTTNYVWAIRKRIAHVPPCAEEVQVAAPEPEAQGVDAILEERGSRYGPFTTHAAITQQLKGVVEKHLHHRGKVLMADQQEALDMIFHKIGRIINGDPDYADSWVDIAGYAKLVADRLEGKVR
jgi:hypothetical protein